ncbi:Sorbitol dehydrogenase [Toxocara canis]|uniref:Sorbitol dehydrogenase n=1 Tax=Toxocara canis TaxID=6265 RepID=A0A0B2UQ11_TOXCA|nr:Sorbitol dehydrogenase [Toxocara canis]
MKASFGSRRLARDRSVPEMFSIESILLGSRELECAIGHLDVSLDPKRTCFSIMNIWLENSCMDVMTGVYCCSPKTPSLRRADLLRRFLFMARKAAAEHTKGNLILFASPGMTQQRCHFDEILQTIASVDLNMAEECYIADGGCFITFESPLATFRLDDIRAVDMGQAVRKNLLKVEIEVPFADEELCDYFEKQPLFFSLSVKKHILFNEQSKSSSPSPELLRLRLNKLLLEKHALDTVGCPLTDILLSPTGKAINLSAFTNDDETTQRVHNEETIERPSSVNSGTYKMSTHGHVDVRSKAPVTHAYNVDIMNNVVIPVCKSPSLEELHEIHNRTLQNMNMTSQKNLCAVLYAKNDIRMEEREIPTPKENQLLIRVHTVGICGSDVHFWKNGAIGQYIVRDLMVLGHETSGTVAAIGCDVKNFKVGDRVALEPCVPCRLCVLCKSSKYNLCADMKFFATPPTDGALARYVVHDADFCFKLPQTMTMEEGSLVEPLSVAVHACRRAYVSIGQTVLILGAGPIGLMNMLSAKAMGASSVFITDISDGRLKLAKALGADYILNVKGMKPEDVADHVISTLKAQPDAAIECTGVASSIESGIHAVKVGGTMVMVGLGGGLAELPMVEAATKEIDLRGSFRYANW